MQRAQEELTFIIGTAARMPDGAEQAIIAAACRVCGGCSVRRVLGAWADDGAAHAENFDGDIAYEVGFELSVSCETHKTDRAYAEIAAAIAEFAPAEVNWVHVQRRDHIAQHFSAHAMRANARGEDATPLWPKSPAPRKAQGDKLRV